ncbi:MAG: hypothetical protein LBG48_04475 [Rickettsiales bacterium]|jgi:hypothetical protein|nr:hypothetical protein [Rickettsiales bacterium]
MNEVKVILGRTEAEVPYTSEKQKTLIEKIVLELNIEFNTLRSSLRGVDETILLFFLLFKTQNNIFQKNGIWNCMSDINEYFMKIFHEISPFICDDEKDGEKVNKMLVAVNIYKRMDLTNEIKNKTPANGKQTLEEFIFKIKEQIKLTEDKISLL